MEMQKSSDVNAFGIWRGVLLDCLCVRLHNYVIGFSEKMVSNNTVKSDLGMFWSIFVIFGQFRTIQRKKINLTSKRSKNINVQK